MDDLLSTPRTQAACKMCGVDAAELIVKSLSDFYVPGDFLERQRLRFSRYEVSIALVSYVSHFRLEDNIRLV